MIPKEFSFLIAGIIVAVTGAVGQTYNPIGDFFNGLTARPYSVGLRQGQLTSLINPADIKECSELDKRLGKEESKWQMRKNAVEGLAYLPAGLTAYEVYSRTVQMQSLNGKPIQEYIEWGIALTSPNNTSAAKIKDLEHRTEEIARKLCYSGSA